MVFAPAVAANAAVSAGGWTALDTITAGATNTINAVKGAGATGMRSAVAVAPSAVKVGKFLIKGGGAAALLLAVPQLIGDGVDWVLDPANNSVKYLDSDSTPVLPPVGQLKYFSPRYPTKFFPTAEAACRYQVSTMSSEQGRDYLMLSMSGTKCTYSYQGYPYSDFIKSTVVTQDDKDKENPVYKHIPIATVAAKVIANAEAGHAPSQEAVKATALEGFAAGEYDAALDAAAVPDTGVENPTDPTDPPKDPAVPFDPAGIISAINALKALLAGILASITGLSDIFNSDPPPEKTQKETDVPIDDLPPTKGASEFDINYINFGGQCPVLPSFNIGIGGASSALTFDMTPLCDMALKIRPAVIAIAYFIGLGVIASAIRET